MAISVEAILADAQRLVLRLKEHDNLADCLVARMQSLQKQLDVMRQFQECLNKLNEVARHRPRLGLIITLAQENSKIRDLQSENMELRQSLSDHQSALEVIMTKYREQLANLSRANQVEQSLLQRTTTNHEDIEKKAEKISEMTAVMCQAANMADSSDNADDIISRLQRENHAMRELLQLELADPADGVAEPEKPATSDTQIQTQLSPDGDPFCTGDFATVRPRPFSNKGQAPVEGCTKTRRSPVPANPDAENLAAKLPPSSAPVGNVVEILSTASDSTGTGNDCLSDVADGSTVSSETELGNFSSSESLETLISQEEVSENEEYL